MSQNYLKNKIILYNSATTLHDPLTTLFSGLEHRFGPIFIYMYTCILVCNLRVLEKVTALSQPLLRKTLINHIAISTPPVYLCSFAQATTRSAILNSSFYISLSFYWRDYTRDYKRGQKTIIYQYLHTLFCYLNGFRFF